MKSMKLNEVDGMLTVFDELVCSHLYITSGQWDRNVSPAQGGIGGALKHDKGLLLGSG